MSDYVDFLNSKRAVVAHQGFVVKPEDINTKLFPFQRDIVRWALQLGRAALFEECGLGKTAQQLEWARHVRQHTNKPVLILAPLAVADQTVREAAKFDIQAEVKYCKVGTDIGNTDIVITNYQRLDKFELDTFGGVVLDESSILKNLGGKTFWQMVRGFEQTPYKLACTATPAPNDHVELTNHSHFLGIMNFKEVMARYFTAMKDGVARTSILKPHGEADFWRWLTSWAVCLSRPGDLGPEYDMPGFDLPPLNFLEYRIAASQETIERTWAEGKLLPDTNPNSTTLHKVKRESLADRIEQAQKIVNALPADEPVILWCDTNDQSSALKAAFPDAVEVSGSHRLELKEERLKAFSNGEVKQIITKPKIAGFGLNWQHCAEPVFTSVSFSFEQLYQALRRSYRFGQERPVNAHVIYADTEGSVMHTLQVKQKDFKVMQVKMNQATHEHGLFRAQTAKVTEEKSVEKAEGKGWELYLGDCVKVAASLPDDSVHFSVFSPPFQGLYIYSSEDADMGNCSTNDEFMQHFGYLVEQLYRITVPGRTVAVHCKDLPLFENRDAELGIQPFSDEITALFRAKGFTFTGRTMIWKAPDVEMQRTKATQLLHKTFKADSANTRPGQPDYILHFRKHPADKDAVQPVVQQREIGDYIGEKPPEPWQYREGYRTPQERYSIALWQKYASPVWMDINQMNVLNYQLAKNPEDEKHICPLQLDVIERLIDWRTNKGDVVFSPFTGIGSEGYVAIKMGRKFIGAELKPDYWRVARHYLEEAVTLAAQKTLFEWAEGQEAAGD